MAVPDTAIFFGEAEMPTSSAGMMRREEALRYVGITSAFKSCHFNRNFLPILAGVRLLKGGLMGILRARCISRAAMRGRGALLLRFGLLRYLPLVGLLPFRPGALDVGQNCFNLFVA